MTSRRAHSKKAQQERLSAERKETRLCEQIAATTAEGHSLRMNNSRLSRLEQELRQANAELARVNQHLDSFAYALSHDLRAPLRKCAALLTFLEEDQDPPLNEAAKGHLDGAVGMADQMSEMIVGVLEYSRARARIEPESIDLDDVLEGALSHLAVAMEEHGAVVEVDPMFRVAGNRHRLIQLFQNLIENAIRYRSEKTPRIRINCVQVGDEVRISVADNGRGIEGTSTDDAFKLFKRMHHDSQGHGIGLALCRQIVEAHQGAICLESEVGVGTTFYVTLQRA